MAKTFELLKSSLQQWLDQDNSAEQLPDPVAGDLVNWVVREYCRNRESRFGEASRTFATVINQRDYAAPARFSKPGELYYFNPDNGSPVWLTFLLKNEFDEKFPGSVAYSTGGPYAIAGLDTTTILGDPTHYTVWAGNLLLAKVPDRVITLFQDYWEIPADLADAPATNTNKMTDEADNYILFKALSSASAFGIEDERIPIWEGFATSLEANLDSEDSRRWQTGRTSQGKEPG